MLEYKKILLRFGELTLKGNKRPFFTIFLIENIQKMLNVKVDNNYDRLFLPYSKASLNLLKYIFGLSSYSPVIEVHSDFAIISDAIKDIIPKLIGQTFKLKVNRHDKSFTNSSMELNKKWGNLVLENSSLTVDVKNPDILIEVEIRKNKTYIFYERIKGLGGLPTGVNGKVLHLISGGIDSPVAAIEMMKRGIHVDFLNFITPPHTNQKTIEKVNKIIEILNLYQGQSILFQSNYTNLLNLLSLSSNKSYRINLMRRSFYRIASNIAFKNDYLGISNGENLNQVASQTLESIITIQSQTKLPIYRPLLTYDKKEIIDKAKQINTYQLSILKASESCELFAPKNPVTKPKIEKSLALENDLQPQLNELEIYNLDHQIMIKKF